MPESRPLAPIAPSAIWTERYEVLRGQAMDGGGTSLGWGLALACRHGLAAWMRAWPTDSVPASKPAAPSSTADPVPDDLRGQIALVMADMILARHTERALPSPQEVFV